MPDGFPLLCMQPWYALSADDLAPAWSQQAADNLGVGSILAQRERLGKSAIRASVVSCALQRARLKALQQRQGPRARVRNYNQQDDVTQ